MRAASKLPVWLGWYLGVALVVPWFNGAGEGFAAHAAWTVGITTAVAGAWLALRAWLDPCRNAAKPSSTPR